MTTESDFRHLLTDLISNPGVAGLSLTGTYESLTGPTVTPPAGTIRQEGQIVGIFETAGGEPAATIDSWGSVASRCEALLVGRFHDGTLADYLNFPLVTLVGEGDRVLTTSVELSHRQADTTWRLVRNELREAGVAFDEIQRKHPDALVTGFPTAIPFGWWHSHTKRSQKAADDANGKKMSSKKNKSALERGRDEHLGYYVMNPADSRSARLFTAEFIATGVRERRRMAAKVDSIFAAVKDDTKIGNDRLSTVGLGSIPPTDLVKKPDRPTPSDLTYDTIESRAFFSFTGLRAFNFSRPESARPLIVTLPLLLYLLHHQNLSLRAGTELRLREPGLQIRVERQGTEPEPLELPDVDDMAALVRDLGAEVGWEGPRVVRITPESPLGKIIQVVDGSTGS